MLKDIEVAVRGKVFLGLFFGLIFLFSPGMLAIFYFNRDLFIQLDVWKLFFLAISITVPLVVLNMIMRSEKVREGIEKDLQRFFFMLVAVIFSALELYLALAISALFDLDVEKFYIIAFIIGVIVVLISWLDGFNFKRK